MIINSHTLQNIYVGFNTLFTKAFEDVEAQYTKVAMIVPSSGREENYTWLGQMPTLREWVDERTIQNLVASSYTIVNKQYELTISVSRNDIMDDQIGVYVPIVKNLGEEAKLHPDTLVFSLLDEGFSKTCYDGLPFFSDAHPLIEHKKNNKEKQSNYGTAALSPESYAAARAQMMGIRGSDGRILKIVPDTLVVPPQLEAVARSILFSDLVNGSTNVYKGTCELLVAPELAEHGKQWYLLATRRGIRPLIFQEREKPHLISKTKEDDDNVFFTGNYLYGINARYNAGYGLWQLAYGSTGETETKG